MYRALTAILLLVPVTASAAEMTCRKSPALTGSCTIVNGSLGLTQGLGVTLVPDDGSRIIIKAPPGSNADIAPAVMQNWLYWQSKMGALRTRITGAFQVCPLPPDINSAGINNFGCISAGSRITVDKSAGPGQ